MAKNRPDNSRSDLNFGFQAQSGTNPTGPHSRRSAATASAAADDRPSRPAHPGAHSGRRTGAFPRVGLMVAGAVADRDHGRGRQVAIDMVGQAGDKVQADLWL